MQSGHTANALRVVRAALLGAVFLGACAPAADWGPPPDAPIVPPPGPPTIASTQGPLSLEAMASAASSSTTVPSANASARASLPSSAQSASPSATTTAVEGPAADAADVDAIVVTVDPKGDVFVGSAKSKSSDTALVEQARKFLAAHPNAHAVIRADQDVKNGRVVGILDRLREAGITRVAIAVAPAQ